ncbi:MAG: hypothetical protein ACRDTR_17190, partial [Rubrobacter sp.]
DMEGVTVLPVTALLDWANPKHSYRRSGPERPEPCLTFRARLTLPHFSSRFLPERRKRVTIRQRGREGVCESQFWIDGEFYQFTFNGKKGMPLLTSKKEAGVYENDLKREIRTGTFLRASDLKNFRRVLQRNL